MATHLQVKIGQVGQFILATEVSFSGIVIGCAKLITVTGRLVQTALLSFCTRLLTVAQ